MTAHTHPWSPSSPVCSVCSAGQWGRAQGSQGPHPAPASGSAVDMLGPPPPHSGSVTRARISLGWPPRVLVVLHQVLWLQVTHPGVTVQAAEGQQGQALACVLLGLCFLSAVASYPDPRAATYPWGWGVGGGVSIVSQAHQKRGSGCWALSLQGHWLPPCPGHPPRPAHITSRQVWGAKWATLMSGCVCGRGGGHQDRLLGNSGLNVPVDGENIHYKGDTGRTDGRGGGHMLGHRV